MLCLPFQCVVIQYDLRLADGISRNGGRLEVQINNVWGTVCDNLWDRIDADVTCRQLGYSGAFIAAAVSEPGNGLPILLDNINCIGNESYIWDCANNGIAMHNCDHSDDVFLVCLPEGDEFIICNCFCAYWSVSECIMIMYSYYSILKNLG